MPRVTRKDQKGQRPPQRITAWSHSRFAKYMECPAKAKYEYIDKLDTGEPGPALVRGSEVHESCEEYLKGMTTFAKLHDVAKIHFADEMKALRKMKAVAECQWAFNVNWKPTSWFGADAWCRVMLDAYTPPKKSTRVIDFKTGRYRENYASQIELYALAAFLQFPKLETVHTELWYLDEGVLVEEEHDRGIVEPLQRKWEKQTRPMLVDETFKATPSSNACRFCSFKKADGGPCKF